MGTNVPALQWTAGGLIIPPASGVLAGVQADINAAFGGGLTFTGSDPQSQLATTQTAIIDAKNSDILEVVNGMDPAYSSGRMQDAIGRLFGLTRIGPTSSVVTCTCSGVPGTVIPVGALATDGTYLWSCTQAGTIGVGGTVSLTFACTTTGPIPAGANIVNQIFAQINGWTGVNNPSTGTTGINVEGRGAFEQRRQGSLAANAQGMIQAVRGAVLNVPGVYDCWAYDNGSTSPTTVNGVTIPANSIYVAVAPGTATNAAIAQAIWTKKGGGAAYYGDTSVTVTDQSAGYNPPYPSYTVTFKTVSDLTILFAVSIPNTAQVPSNYATLIQNAIVSAMAGGDGGPKATIGATLYASRYVSAIAALGAWAQPISVQVGTSSANANSVAVDAAHLPVTAAANITVTLV